MPATALKQIVAALVMPCLQRDGTPPFMMDSAYDLLNTTLRGRSFMQSLFSRAINNTIKLTACEITVAAAAPVTPMSKVKMKSGSSATFSTPPAAMPNIE